MSEHGAHTILRHCSWFVRFCSYSSFDTMSGRMLLCMHEIHPQKPYSHDTSHLYIPVIVAPQKCFIHISLLRVFFEDPMPSVFPVQEVTLADSLEVTLFLVTFLAKTCPKIMDGVVSNAPWTPPSGFPRFSTWSSWRMLHLVHASVINVITRSFPRWCVSPVWWILKPLQRRRPIWRWGH